MKTRLVPLILFCLISFYSKGQENISIIYNYGDIFIHTNKLNHLATGPVKGFSINYAFINNKNTLWRKNFNDPDVGLSYNYKTYNNPDVLGNSHSITRYIRIPFLAKPKPYNIGIKSSAGFGFFTKKYHEFKNPTSTAISADININFEMRAFAKINIEQFFFEYSWGINHFSNGLIKYPNLGLNVLNHEFCLGTELRQQPQNSKTPKELENLEIKKIKHELWAYSSFGIRAGIDSDTELYNVGSASINYAKQVSSVNKMGIGLDVVYDQSLTPYAIEEYNYMGNDKINLRSGIYLHNEIVMGNFGLFTSYGIYFGKTDYYITRAYYKGGFKFYFGDVVGSILIRAIPLFRAEVIEFGIGYNFTKY